mmetsp:Transcript_2368/g.2484  ORF Transcript_2368/g.2484 Transcript_2368/m.2484 type:complete len:446 (+) Transcript_2368:50-1387(+)
MHIELTVPERGAPFHHNKMLLQSVTIVGIFLTFIPLFLKGYFSDSDIVSEEKNSSPINYALQSQLYRSFLLCSISGSIALLLDSLKHLHSLVFLKSAFDSSNYSRLILLISIIVPNAIIFSDKCTTECIPSIYMSQSIIIFYIGSISLRRYGGVTWNNYLLLVINILIVISIAISRNKQFLPSYIFNQIYCIRLGLHLTSFIAFLILSFKWYYLIIFRNDYTLSSNDRLCNAYIILFLTIGIIFMISYGIYHETSISNITEFNLIMILLVVVIATVVITVFLNDERREGFDEKTESFHRLENELKFRKLFILYISHEMRTPLNTVYAGLDVLKRKLETIPNADDEIEILKEIKIACNIAIETLNDILTFDKIEGGQLRLEKTVVHVFDFIRTAVRPFLIQAEQLGIFLTVIPNAALMNVSMEVDVTKLSQVIETNLLTVCCVHLL